MLTGLLSFLVFLLSFSLLTDTEMINDQCRINPTLIPPQEYIIRFHNGYTWSQHVDHLSSNVPFLRSSGFAAKHIVNGYTATIPEDVLPHIAADPNVWGISDSGYVYVVGDGSAICTVGKEEQDRRVSSAAEMQERTSQTTQQPLWVGKQHIVGLRESGHVGMHLASLPAELQQQVEQLIPEINGYAIPSLVSRTTLDLIREDPHVGFIVRKPRGFFEPNGGKEL